MENFKIEKNSVLLSQINFTYPDFFFSIINFSILLNFELYILNSLRLHHMPLVVIDHKPECVSQF